METTHRIRIDMLRKGVPPIVDAMQLDTNTRVVSVAMFENGVLWNPPGDAVFSLSYRKPDGTVGFYNKLSDDESAVSVDGNTVSVVLAHQVLTVPGIVDAALVAYSGQLRIATFPFEIHVTADPSAGKTDSDDYFNPEGGTGGGSTGGSSGCSIAALTGWEIVQASDAVTLNYTLEDGSEHTDVITLDANGYPVSIAHDGATAPGTWRDADA